MRGTNEIRSRNVRNEKMGLWKGPRRTPTFKKKPEKEKSEEIERLKRKKKEHFGHEFQNW